ncbi:MAG: hypothetical protein KJ795_06480 [Gammaproteobacteria bacterium]|nr:hypothetical protein [Gammaproteobacteria bacterium]MBU1776317.1 hypothetical protein [Gammaproteobacteria bacterium]MBU1969628.1 hypothetical protein [Gammaproteobacteria bacterium]
MNTADMLIYIHPDLDMQSRTGLEREVMGHIGVDCAEFTPQEHSHALMVKYDPDAVEGIEILQVVRKLDPGAAMVGM